jgi:hypothetical protein
MAQDNQVHSLSDAVGFVESKGSEHSDDYL